MGKIMDSASAIELITVLFEENLPCFDIVRIVDDGNYYGYCVSCKFKDVSVMIGGQRGGVDYSITFGDTQVALDDFDQRAGSIYGSSEADFRLLFEILRMYLRMKHICP